MHNYYCGIVNFNNSSKKAHGSPKQMLPGLHVHVFSNDIVKIYSSSNSASGFVAVVQTNQYFLVGIVRLYNKEILFEKLQLQTNIPDAELLLNCFEKWGEKCLNYLIGDFSFAIWDKLKKELFLAKDQIGVKPLFYFKNDDFYIFSSDIPSIKRFFSTPLLINQEYIAYALKNFPVRVEDTFFADIKRLKPAHYCLFSNSSGFKEETRYWDLKKEDISCYNSETELMAELKKRMTEAIVCRDENMGNIACQLSGGMDSSAIAVLLARNIDKKRLYTYSFVLNDFTKQFSESKIDERDTQQEIIKYGNLIPENHYNIESFHYKDVFEEFDTTNNVMGGYADSNGIWQDSMFREMQKNDIKVSFSGFPGDEGISVNGRNYFYDYIANPKYYCRFLAEYKLKAIKMVYGYIKFMILGTYVPEYKKVQQERNLLNPTSAYNKTIKDESFKFYPSFKKYLKAQMLRPHTTLRSESEGLYAAQYGIHTVYPLTDIRLLSFVYSLPPKMFRPKPYTRALFRNVCEGILPDKVRLQPKFSGALTLAFAEYWKKDKEDQLKDYVVKNKLNLFNIDKLKDEKFKSNLIKQVDYLININS